MFGGSCPCLHLRQINWGIPHSRKHQLKEFKFRRMIKLREELWIKIKSSQFNKIVWKIRWNWSNFWKLILIYWLRLLTVLRRSSKWSEFNRILRQKPPIMRQKFKLNCLLRRVKRKWIGNCNILLIFVIKLSKIMT